MTGRRNGHFPRRPNGTDPDGYHPTHRLVYKAYGHATWYSCVDCDEDAEVWSWNRVGPSRSGIVSGKRVTWGTDIRTFSPRCRRHAVIMDGHGTPTHFPCGHARADNETTDRQCLVCTRARSLRRHRARAAQRRALATVGAPISPDAGADTLQVVLGAQNGAEHTVERNLMSDSNVIPIRKPETLEQIVREWRENGFTPEDVAAIVAELPDHAVIALLATA